MLIRIPANWKPRDYQLPAWSYLERGGKHAEIIAHRRWGKDDLALHWTCVAAHQRVANYWHMLPLANQARKAIWAAVNPHTGRRRIDEAFPLELRATTRDNEMVIVLKNGSTWQVLGSDNYQGSIGSSPAGIVYSEWAQSDPSSRGYLRPILAENGGWQLYITTPRGHNHAERTFRSAQRDGQAFAMLSRADETGVFTAEQLEAERQAYIDDYGEDFGVAFFEQEYLCSFNAAILGSVYGSWIERADRDGRIGSFPWDPELPVHTAWDLGYSDAVAIWFWQMFGGEIRVIDFYETNGQDIEHYCEFIKGKPYSYGMHVVPHDGKHKTLAGGGRSIIQQANDLGVRMTLSAQTGQQNQIQAARLALKRTWFNVPDQDSPVAEGLERLRQYQFEWDDERRMFRDTPRHDWTSHAADAYELIGKWWREKHPEPPPVTQFPEAVAGSQIALGGKTVQQPTFDDLVNARRRRRLNG